MHEERVAKRYVLPLMQVCDATSLDNVAVLLEAVSAGFKEEKMVRIMLDNAISSASKEALLLAVVAPAQSDVVNNLIKLLAQKNRLMVLPAIAEELKRQIARSKRSYNGRIYSDVPLEASAVATIAHDLGKKVNATVSLELVVKTVDSIRVEVDDLNVEINFSKARLNAQLIEHILKAI